MIEIITHTGWIQIGDIKLYAMISQNGKRLITLSDVFKAVGRQRRGVAIFKGYPPFIGAKNLIPFIDDELNKRLKPIYYKAKNGKIAKDPAYDATIIPRLADLYIEAHSHKALKTNQKQAYQKSVIIVRSLAKLGITALIDEATGYENDREGQALQTLLKAYISEDLMKWQKRFPDSFYKEVYRLYGLTYNPNNPKKPSYIGKFTNNYVYEVFPEKVLEEIKRRNPPKFSHKNLMYRKHKHFQYLTEDIGIKQLDSQLQQVTAIMKVSKNMKEFKNNFYKAFKEDLARKKQIDDKNNGMIALF